MKKRTQIAAWMYIAVSIVAALSLRIVKASSVHFPRFGIHLGHGIMLMIDTIILNVLIIAGWILLIRGRAWAWWMLVVLYLLILGRLIAEYAAHGYELYLVLIIGVPSIFCFSLLPLILLLTDRAHTGDSPSSTPDACKGAGPMPRTCIAAYVFAIISAAMFLSVFTATDGKWRLALMLAPLAVEWPFWILLSRGRKWAWTVLVVMYCTLPVANTVADMPFCQHMASLPGIPAMSIGMMVLSGIIVSLPVSGIHLAFLLTDRPSNWPEPKPLKEEPKPRVHGPKPRKRRRRY